MKSYIVFNMGQDYHDADDVVVRIMLTECDDPRHPDAGDEFVDIALNEVLSVALLDRIKRPSKS